ncbi:MAG: hypothetical protein JWM86_2026 [Thermoleophilia bacterium]|nr:hypothetical protein [Thermoleophilia bacterium]
MLRFSSLGRPIAPWHPATAWALAACSTVFVTTSLAHGLGSGFRGAVAVFLAWAITRELAPKRALASALAPFAGVAFAIPADTDLRACFAALLAARIAARTVGDPITRLDVVSLTVLCAWFAQHPAGLPVALVLAAVVFADGPPRRARVAGVLALAAAIGVGALEGTLTLRPGWDDVAVPGQVLITIAGAATAWLVVAPLPARLRTRDDRRRGHLSGDRIRTARVVALAGVLAAVAWVGLDGVFALSSASAALLAAGLGGATARAAGDTAS